jgi:hypothetical protein
MKKLCLLILVALFATGLAVAQVVPPACTSGQVPTVAVPCTPAPGTLPTGLSSTAFNVALGQDVLGAHNGYGRGCVMCHAPHGGALGNGGGGTGTTAATADATGNGALALWGENLEPLYSQSVQINAGYTVSLPASPLTSNPGTNSGATTVILCLSCHDGAVSRPAMMQGQTVEALPIVGGTAPTLFGLTTGNSALTYINEHPVGSGAIISPGTSHNWDGSGGGTSTTDLTMGPNWMKFALTDYPASIWYTYAKNGGAAGDAGFPLASFTGTVNAVTCTTCHNQHSMTVYVGGNGLSYPTMFFIKGEYMPASGGNSVAQFCRNCHGGESNEMAGLTVPTT